MEDYLVGDEIRIPHEDESGDDDQGLGHDGDRADDLVEVRRDLDATNVEPDQEDDAGHRLDQP